MVILNTKEKRIVRCMWCDKEVIVYYGRGWDKRKFCSDMCREEYHSFNDRRSPFYKEEKKREEIVKDKNKYVKCGICGQLARRRLSTHIRKKHNLTWKEYIKKFPNAQNECEEVIKFVYTPERYPIGIKNPCFKNGWKTITEDRKRKVGVRCEICGFDKYPEAITGHHKLPKYLHGKDRIDNCILLCENCHKHIHHLIREIIKQKNYTIEDIVRTCEKSQEANSKS